MEATSTCGTRKQSSNEKLHWMIHDISYEVEQGNLNKAKELLLEADLFTHDLVSAENT